LPGWVRDEDAIPGETTIIKFRRRLEIHQMAQSLFNESGLKKGLLLRQGTIVDAP